MTKLKRLLAVTLSAASLFAFATYASAAQLSEDANYYTFEIKLQDANGREIKEIGPGSEVMLSVYARPTEEVADNTIEITADTGNSFSYEFYIPKGFMADEASFTGKQNASFNKEINNTGKCNISDAGDKGFLVFADYGSIVEENDYTVSPDKPIGTFSLTVSKDFTKNSEYTFSFGELTIYDSYELLEIGSVITPSTELTKNIDKTVTVKEQNATYTDTDGRTLKYVSYAAVNASANKPIYVTKTLEGKSETKSTGKSIVELLGNGVAVDETTISCDIAFGVLTKDTDAIFTFEIK